MPARILERDYYPKRCKCGFRGFIADKETDEIIVWKCGKCGRTQKFKKGRVIELPWFFGSPSWFNN